MWILVYHFHGIYMLAGKTFLDYINLFSPNDYKKNDKIMISILKINMAEEASLQFRLKKIDETKNYLVGIMSSASGIKTCPTTAGIN